MEYYPRKIEEKMDKWVGRKEYIIIKGPRQSGKTTTLLHLKEELRRAEYLTLEDPEWREAFERDVKRVAERVLEREKSILLVDEAQYVKNVGERLKLLFDLYGDRLKVVATGSGSFDIRVEVGKHLVGRAIYFELMPLTFEEFLMWKAKDLHKTFLDYMGAFNTFLRNGKLDTEPLFEGEFQNLLDEYVLLGGFPAVVKENDPEIKRELLKNLVRTYIERDVFYFLGVRKLEKFNDLMRLLSFNIGSVLNYSSVCQLAGMDFRTLENYLSVMRQTYVIDLLPPFFRNLTTELRKSRKIYFLDTGLRNSIMNNFTPLESREDAGRLLENSAFIQLRSHFGKMNFWRTTGKAEVDFVLTRGLQLVPVEVKTRDARVGRGFTSFIRTYKPKVAVILTSGKFGVKRINGTKVAFMPHYFI